MNRISIINDEISDETKEVINFLQKNKLHHVELRSFNKTNIANISLYRLNRYAQQFKRNKIKVSCIASPLLKWNYGNKQPRDIGGIQQVNHFYVKNNDSYEKIFKIADIFGTKYIRIFSYFKYPNFKILDLEAAIGQLVILAEKYDKILLMENEPVCNICNPNHLVKLLNKYDNKRIKILFDLGNIYKQGGILKYEELNKIKEHIVYIHIKDYSFEEKTYKVLGEGDINYKKFISWIEKEIKHDIFYSLETHVSTFNRLEESEKSLEELRRLVTEKRVKYGIVGCGRIFKKHALAIKNCPNAELFGVFDTNRDKIRVVAKINDCYDYSVLEDLLSDVDVVNICTPHNTHAEIIDKVLKKNKYCLCEKPGSLNRVDMAKVKDNHNYKNKLFVVYQNRFNKTIIKLKEIINAGKLGRIVYIFGSVRWFRDKDYYKKSIWQGRQETEGGILFNQGAHIIDIILSLLPEKTEASIVNSVRDKIYHKEISTEDIFIAQFKVKKILVNLEITVSSLPSNLDSNLFIIFERGRAVISGKSLESSLNIEALDRRQNVDLKIIPNKDVYGSAHMELISSLTNYVQTSRKNENLVDYDEACYRVELINSLYKLCNN